MGVYLYQFNSGEIKSQGLDLSLDYSHKQAGVSSLLMRTAAAAATTTTRWHSKYYARSSIDEDHTKFYYLILL